MTYTIVKKKYATLTRYNYLCFNNLKNNLKKLNFYLLYNVKLCTFVLLKRNTMILLTQKQCEDLGWVFKTDGYFKHAIKNNVIISATSTSITGLRMRISCIEQELKLKTL